MNATLLNEIPTLDQYVNVRLEAHQSLRTIALYIKKASLAVLNGIPFYIIKIQNNSKNELILQIRTLLAEQLNQNAKTQLFHRVFINNGNIYIFFIKKYPIIPIPNTRKSRPTSLLNDDVDSGFLIAELRSKSNLDPSESEFLQSKTINTNVTLQCLAAEALAHHGLFALPKFLQNQFICFKSISEKQDTLDSLDQIAFPQCGNQALLMAEKIDELTIETKNPFVIVKARNWQSTYFLKNLFKATHVPEEKDLRNISSADNLVIIDLPADQNIFQALDDCYHKLKNEGYLLLSAELISPFQTVEEQNLSFWRYKLYQLMQLLWEGSQLNTQINLNGHDLILYQQFQFSIFMAYVLVNKLLFKQAERILFETFRTCSLLLQDRMLASPLILFRMALGKLEALLEENQQFDETKTNVNNVISLAEGIGFKNIEHHRIFAGPGPNVHDSGTHLIVLQKAITSRETL